MFARGELSLRHLERIAKHTGSESIARLRLVERVEFCQRRTIQRLASLMTGGAEVGHQVVAAGDAERGGHTRIESGEAVDVGVGQIKDR